MFFKAYIHYTILLNQKLIFLILNIGKRIEIERYESLTILDKNKKYSSLKYISLTQI